MKPRGQHIRGTTSGARGTLTYGGLPSACDTKLAWGKTAHDFMKCSFQSSSWAMISMTDRSSPLTFRTSPQSRVRCSGV